MKSHYIYTHSVDGVVFYVGKGSGGRAFTKGSRNSLWETFVCGSPVFDIALVAFFVEKKEAFDFERALIFKLKPCCNVNAGQALKIKKIRLKKPKPPLKKKQPVAKVEGIRLPPHLWPMFRQVLRAKGRMWLEKLIDREHKKLEGQHERR